VVNSFSPSSSSICSGSSVTLSWTASDTGGSGLSKVEVWQRPSGGSWTKITSGDCSGDKPSSGSCIITPTITTDYGIHAIDNALNCIDEKGSHCAGVSSDSLDPRAVYGPDTVTVNTIPSIPSNLSFNNITGTQIQLNWNDNSSNETGFKIYRNTASSRSGATELYTTQPNATTWTNISLSCGTTYYCGDDSNEVITTDSKSFNTYLCCREDAGKCF